MSRIVVRADASPSMGLGHLRRCLALAAELQAGGAVVQVAWRHAGVDVAGLCAAYGVASHRLSDAVCASPLKDAEGTAVAMREFQADGVVVDHYGLASAWHERVREATGAKVVVIDDLADRPLAPDLLIDHNLSPDHALKYAEVLPEGVPILAGPRYALLDRAYGRHDKVSVLPQAQAGVRSIGVFMGGTDAGGFSEYVIDTLRGPVGFSGRIEVASTSSNPALEGLRRREAGDAGVSLTLDNPNLADFFGRHDLQVGAGGGALWERCCIGAPTLALVCADNQLLSVPLLASLGAAVGLDARERDEHVTGELAAALRGLLDSPQARRALSERSKSLVDGFGAARAAAAIMDLIGARVAHVARIE